MKPFRTLILAVLALVVVGAVAYALYTKKALSPTEEVPAGEVAAEQSYTNEVNGFSFTYPEGYVLTEREVEGRTSITLVRAEDATPPENGEGPVAVTIDVYAKGEGSVANWIETAPESNFTLGNGRTSAVPVAGTDGISYVWSGLYEGRTTVFAHGDTLIAASVTWMTPQDEQLKAYEAVIASFRFAGTREHPILQ